MKHLSDIEVPESGWDFDYTATHNLGDWRGVDIDAMLEGLWNQVHFEMKHGCNIPSPCMVAKYMEVCLEAKRLMEHSKKLNDEYNESSIQ